MSKNQTPPATLINNHGPSPPPFSSSNQNSKAKAKLPDQQFVLMVHRYPFGEATQLQSKKRQVVVMNRRCTPQEHQEIRKKIQHHSRLRHPNLIRLLRAYESRKAMIFDLHLQYVHHSIRKCRGILSPDLIEDNRLRLINLCSYLMSVNIYPQVAEELLGVDDKGFIKLYLDVDFRVLSPGVNKSELFKVKEVQINNILNQYMPVDAIHLAPSSLSPPNQAHHHNHLSPRSLSGKTNFIIYTSRSVDATPHRFGNVPEQVSSYNYNPAQNMSIDTSEQNVPGITVFPSAKNRNNLSPKANNTVAKGRNRHMSTMIPVGQLNILPEKDVHSSMYSNQYNTNGSVVGVGPRVDQSCVIRPFGPKSITSNNNNAKLKHSMDSSFNEKRNRFLQEYTAFHLEGPTTVGPSSNLPTVIDDSKLTKNQENSSHHQNQQRLVQTPSQSNHNNNNNSSNNPQTPINNMVEQLSVIRERSVRRSEPAASSKRLPDDNKPSNNNNNTNSKRLIESKSPEKQLPQNSKVTVSRQNSNVSHLTGSKQQQQQQLLEQSKINSNYRQQTQKLNSPEKSPSPQPPTPTTLNNNNNNHNSQNTNNVEQEVRRRQIMIQQQQRQLEEMENKLNKQREQKQNQQRLQQQQYQQQQQYLQQQQYQQQQYQQQQQQQQQNEQLRRRQQQESQKRQLHQQQQQLLVQQQHQQAQQRIEYVQENSFDTYHQQLGEVIQMPKMMHTELRQTTQSPPKLPSPQRKTKLHESVGFNSGKFLQQKSKRIQEQDQNYTISQHPDNVNNSNSNNHLNRPGQSINLLQNSGRLLMNDQYADVNKNANQFRKKQSNFESQQAYARGQNQQNQQYHYNNSNNNNYQVQLSAYQLQQQQLQRPAYSHQHQQYNQQQHQQHQQNYHDMHAPPRQDERVREYMYRMVNNYPAQDAQDSRCQTSSENTNKQSRYEPEYRSGYMPEKDDPLTKEFNNLFGDDFDNDNAYQLPQNIYNNQQYHQSQNSQENGNGGRLVVIDSGEAGDEDYCEIQIPDNHAHERQYVHTDQQEQEYEILEIPAKQQQYQPPTNTSINMNNSNIGNKDINERVKLALERSVAMLQQFNSFKSGPFRN